VLGHGMRNLAGVCHHAFRACEAQVGMLIHYPSRRHRSRERLREGVA
jgi:hypothetical protein